MMFDLQNIVGSPIIGLLPIIIIVNLIVGIWAAIKEKKFQFKKLPDFMLKGAIFFGFLLILDVTYQSFSGSDIGDIAITGVQTLRGVAWLAIIMYYFSQIYKNLRIIGMPQLINVEDQLQEHSEIEETFNDEEDA